MGTCTKSVKTLQRKRTVPFFYSEILLIKAVSTHLNLTCFRAILHPIPSQFLPHFFSASLSNLLYSLSLFYPHMKAHTSTHYTRVLMIFTYLLCFPTTISTNKQCTLLLRRYLHNHCFIHVHNNLTCMCTYLHPEGICKHLDKYIYAREHTHTHTHTKYCSSFLSLLFFGLHVY